MTHSRNIFFSRCHIVRSSPCRYISVIALDSSMMSSIMIRGERASAFDPVPKCIMSYFWFRVPRGDEPQNLRLPEDFTVILIPLRKLYLHTKN